MRKLTDDRGQVGIGTLIVFIALVLVAAIAAGVLINTAGFLQTQAEETGQDSTDQVADNINVIGEVGEVSDDTESTNAVAEDSNGNPVVYEPRLTVQRSPGADNIDLAGLSIQFVGDNGFANLVHVSEQLDENDELDGAEDVYFVQVITADTEGDTVLTDDGDRYEIVIPLIEIEADDTDTDGTANEISRADTTVEDGTDGRVVDDPDAAYGSESDIEVDLLADAAIGAGGETAVVVDNTVSLDALTESDNVELEVTTNAGSQRNVALTVPDSLIGEEGGTVTL